MDNRTDDVSPHLDHEIQDFLLQRKIRKLTECTLQWHEHCLGKFRDFCYQHNATASQQITANLLRRSVLMREEKRP